MLNGQNEEKMKTVLYLTQIKIKVFASVVVNPVILHTILQHFAMQSQQNAFVSCGTKTLTVC